MEGLDVTFVLYAVLVGRGSKKDVLEIYVVAVYGIEDVKKDKKSRISILIVIVEEA